MLCEGGGGGTDTTMVDSESATVEGSNFKVITLNTLGLDFYCECNVC